MLKRILVVIGLILCVFVVPASAIASMTVAVFPIEDLSLGQNGVNQTASELIAWELHEKGLEVIAADAVMGFMARNRVRWLGYLDTKYILMAKEELGADLVLLGTMTNRDVSREPILGLTLYLVRTDDGRTLWTGVGGTSKEDVINLLGIAEPDDLLPLLTKNVLRSWPDEYQFAVEKQPILEIEKVAIGPEHVRRGEEVRCSITLRQKFPENSGPRVFYKAGGRVHLAKESDDGYTYNASWQVSSSDGRYPVTMVMNWPTGRKKVTFLGAFNVDSTPPEMVLNLKGIKLEGTVAFRDRVIIMPKLLSREAVSRWQIAVEDASGEAQMKRAGYGNLPSRFVWNGKNRQGWPAEEGVYNVVIKAWDLADNLAVSSEQVALARTPPAMVLEAKNKGRDMVVDLSHEGKVPIAFWRMEMRSKDGEIIKVAEGRDLPVRMDVPLADQDSETRKVECTITIKDVLGNLTKEKIQDLALYAKSKIKDEEANKESKSSWVEEF